MLFAEIPLFTLTWSESCNIPGNACTEVLWENYTLKLFQSLSCSSKNSSLIYKKMEELEHQ